MYDGVRDDRLANCPQKLDIHTPTGPGKPWVLLRQPWLHSSREEPRPPISCSSIRCPPLTQHSLLFRPSRQTFRVLLPILPIPVFRLGSLPSLLARSRFAVLLSPILKILVEDLDFRRSGGSERDSPRARVQVYWVLSTATVYVRLKRGKPRGKDGMEVGTGRRTSGRMD